MPRIPIIVSVVALATFGVAACGDDDTAAGDIERYCEITQQLDEAGEREVELDFESGAPDAEQVRAEFSEFLDDHADEIDELERVAPDEITDDVETLIASLRDVAETGDFAAFDDAEEAEERLSRFEERECGRDDGE